jgi:hypothetical protein
MGLRFWYTPETELSPLDRSMLCDECQAGVDGLRKSMGGDDNPGNLRDLLRVQ